MNPGNSTEASARPSAVKEVEALAKKFLNREDWLNATSLLREEEHNIEGLGWLVLSELTGDMRADIVAEQSIGLLADHKKIDTKRYHRKLILNGVVDPTTPKGARLPMFRPGDIDNVMKLGGSKIAEVVDVIERLSSLGVHGAQKEVAGNSEGTQNGDGTS